MQILVSRANSETHFAANRTWSVQHHGVTNACGVELREEAPMEWHFCSEWEQHPAIRWIPVWGRWLYVIYWSWYSLHMGSGLVGLSWRVLLSLTGVTKVGSVFPRGWQTTQLYIYIWITIGQYIKQPKMETMFFVVAHLNCFFSLHPSVPNAW